LGEGNFPYSMERKKNKKAEKRGRKIISLQQTGGPTTQESRNGHVKEENFKHKPAQEKPGRKRVQKPPQRNEFNQGLRKKS